jgi:hypothetical protein
MVNKKTTAGDFLPPEPHEDDDGFIATNRRLRSHSKKRNEKIPLELQKRGHNSYSIPSANLTEQMTNPTHASTTAPVAATKLQNRYSPLDETTCNDPNIMNSPTPNNKNTTNQQPMNNSTAPTNDSKQAQKMSEGEANNHSSNDVTREAASHDANEKTVHLKPHSLQNTFDSAMVESESIPADNDNDESQHKSKLTTSTNLTATPTDDSQFHLASKTTLEHGSIEWCATGHRCNNSTVPAHPTKHRCQTCRRPIHAMCGAGEDGQMTCFVCMKESSANDKPPDAPLKQKPHSTKAPDDLMNTSKSSPTKKEKAAKIDAALTRLANDSSESDSDEDTSTKVPGDEDNSESPVNDSESASPMKQDKPKKSFDSQKTKKPKKSNKATPNNHNENESTVSFADEAKLPTKPKDQSLSGNYGVTLRIKSTNSTPLQIHSAVEQFMDAFKMEDPDLRIMSIPDKSTVRLSAKSVCDKKGDPINKISRYTSLLKTNDRKEIVGKVFMTSNISFSLILKCKAVKQHLHVGGMSISVRINNLDSAIPSTVGFFLHKLVRSDSIYNYREYIRQQLPKNHPKFQVEPGYINAGKDNDKRSVQVMMISTKLSDSDKMATILEKKFHNPTHMTFVKLRNFLCLDTPKKLQLIRSQTTFAKLNRTYMIWDIISLNVKVLKSVSPGQTIKEWLKNIKTANGTKMFLDVMDSLNNNVELMTSNENEYEVRMWLKGSHAHIARVVDPQQHSQVFLFSDEIEKKLKKTSPWRANTMIETIVLLDDSDDEAKKQKAVPKPGPSKNPWKSVPIPKTIDTTETADANTVTTAADSEGEVTLTNEKYSSILAQLSSLKTHDQVRETALKSHENRLAALEATNDDTSAIDDINDRLHTVEKISQTVTTGILTIDEKVNAHITMATEFERRLAEVEARTEISDSMRCEAMEAQIAVQRTEFDRRVTLTDKRFYADHRTLKAVSQQSSHEKDRNGRPPRTRKRKTTRKEKRLDDESMSSRSKSERTYSEDDSDGELTSPTKLSRSDPKEGRPKKA